MRRREHLAIDLSSIESKQALHEALKNALEFPDWYGRNWDAFWDGITGLVDMPAKLQFLGWSAFAARLPEEARQLRSALEEMSTKYPTSAAQVSYA